MFNGERDSFTFYILRKTPRAVNFTVHIAQYIYDKDLLVYNFIRIYTLGHLNLVLELIDTSHQ